MSKKKKGKRMLKAMSTCTNSNTDSDINLELGIFEKNKDIEIARTKEIK